LSFIMHHSRFSLPRVILIAVAAMFIAAGQAQAARRGFKLITAGETVDVIGQAKPDVLAKFGPGASAYPKVGFKYDFAGLFWLDIWNWDGAYALTDGTHYAIPTLTKEQAAELLGTTPDKLGKPFNYRFPYLLDIIVVLGLLKIVPRLIAKRKHSGGVPEYKQQDVPAWTPPASPPVGTPAPPAAGGPPPVPPPLPPEDK
jgi:hypothetical protein